MRLSRLLRPVGVPLPAVLAADLEAAWPFMLLERLPGMDLGHVMRTLGDEQLAAIAVAVAGAQAVVGGTSSAGRYGFAAEAEQAPHERWSGLVASSIDRSRDRIARARLFDARHAGRLVAAMEARREVLDRVPATPFLHDTTTKNVIVAPDGSFSGIVDVDDLCFGDPRFAPALTLASMIAHDGPRQYVGYWQRAAGWAMDDVFDFYVALFLLDFMSEHGQVFNGNERPSEPEERRRLEAAFLEAAGRL